MKNLRSSAQFSIYQNRQHFLISPRHLLFFHLRILFPSLTLLLNCGIFINDQRSNLGAVQNRLGFADSNLMSSIQNTESSLSTIRDADFAFEASNIDRTQILTQSGTAMLD